MITVTILAMTLLVFFSRYLFIEPRIPLKLNGQALRFLSYAGSAVLTAIWGPIVFTREGLLAITPDNPYLIGALLAGLIVWRSGNVLLSVGISMGVFLLLNLH